VRDTIPETKPGYAVDGTHQSSGKDSHHWTVWSE